RLDITHKLTKMMIQMEKKPDVFITGSAVGCYGMSDEKIFTENTTKSGDEFLGYLSSAWEKAAATAEDLEFALFIHDSVLYWINIKEHYPTWPFLSKQVSEVKLEAVHNGCRGFILMTASI